MASAASSSSSGSSPTVYDLRSPVSAHSFNADRTQCAVVHNDSDVIIYGDCNKSPEDGGWKKLHTLSKHDQLVSGVDWCDATNQIVTCSHDRNSFVFGYDAKAGKWTEFLVVLRLPMGATDVRWSPNGEKFVVTSAMKELRVCTFDDANNWWCGEAVRKADKSTIFTAAWHPNSQMIATASARKTCRVFSAYVEETGEEHQAGPFSDVSDFGERIVEFEGADGFVEGVAWSPNGHQLAFVAHDSSINFVTFPKGGSAAPQVQRLSSKHTPNTEVLFLSDTTVVAAGHEMNPMLYSKDDAGVWSFKEFLDKKQPKEKKAAASSIAQARSLFAARTDLGTQSADDITSSMATQHTCSISCLRPYAASSKGGITSFSTSATDGRIIVWPLAGAALGDIQLDL